MMTLDEYTDDLHKALRFHEISGERMGEVLAEVEAHVAETGEDPVDAFGRPRDYAKQVAAQLDPATGKRSTGGMVLAFVAIATLALFGQTFFGDGLALDEAGVAYTLRDVVAQPLLLVAVVVVFLLVHLARTAQANNKLYAGGAVVAVIAGVGAQMLCNKFLDDEAPVVTAPSWLILALGVVFLIGMFAMLAHSIRRGRVRYPNKN
ncbi:HAAS signaling domain-containing protein [Saccharopolyspora endophytica]|uniref:DUF1700 domain-containing protein n=1 Tax=Saccharopolyspora endophytica TaxID=543886 RepID=A0ABS5DFK8_9PSEU|nr:hypothetical protein [Saccharopolyspora endophytica]MBQ0925069.1 hypothetical protein [Saccharopolyspora endophytica]